MQCTFFFLCPFQLTLVPRWTALSTSSCTPTTDCLLFQQCVLICGGKSTSLRGSWWVISSSVLQQALVFVMGSSCLYWVRKFCQEVEEGRMKASTFYVFKCLNHPRNPASAPPFALFSGGWGAGDWWCTRISAEIRGIFLHLSALRGLSGSCSAGFSGTH